MDTKFNKIKILRTHGVDSKTTPPTFVAAGYNYRLTDFQSALGISQIKRLKQFIWKRRGIAQNYIQNIDKEKFIPTKWCFNPNTMPVNGEFKKDIFLSHAGGLHADRVQLLNEFQAKGLNPQCATNCFYEEIKQLWTRSRYSLCFTKNSVLTGTQAKGRVSEIPYFTVMLSQWFDGIEEYYEPDKEFILFETVDEAISPPEV